MGGAAPKKVAPPDPSEIAAAQKNAEAEQLPHEAAQGPAPEATPQMVRYAGMKAAESLRLNPQQPGSDGAAYDAGRRKALDAITPDARPPEADVVREAFEARRRHDPKAAQRGYGRNLTTVSKAFGRLLKAMAAEKGRVSGSDIWHLVAYLHGPSVVADGGIGVLHGSRGGLASAPLVDPGLAADYMLAKAGDGAPPERLLASEEAAEAAERSGSRDALTASRRRGYELAAALWRARVVEARRGLLRPVPDAAPGSPERTLSDGLNHYLAHAKAAESVGYAWREPVFDARFSAARRWREALASVRVGPDLGGTFGDLLGDHGLDGLLRAYEVLNGVGGPDAAARRTEVWGHMHGLSATPKQARENVQGLHLYWRMASYEAPPAMAPERARAIVDAFEAGEPDALFQALGVTAPELAGSGHETVEADADAVPAFDGPRAETARRMYELLRPPSLALEHLKLQSEAGTPTVSHFTVPDEGESLGLRGDASVLDDAAGRLEARELLAQNPRPVMLAAEKALQAELSADPAAKESLLADARDLLAYQHVRVEALADTPESPYGIEGDMGELPLRLLMGELGESAATTRAGNHAADRIRALKTVLAVAARERGWYVADADGAPVESPELLHRIAEIRRALEPELATVRKRRNPFDWEGDDPLQWLCGSPCPLSSSAVADDALRDAEKVHGKRRSLREVHRNILKAMASGRNVLGSYATTYARQWRDPAVREYVHSFGRRYFASLRDRFGETLATVLGKSHDRYHQLTAEHTARWLEIFRRHGYRTSADLTSVPSWDRASEAERVELAERAMIAQALEGQRDPATLPDRAAKAYRDAREMFRESRRVAAQHVFRRVVADAEAALRERRPVSGEALRRHRRNFGDIDDPQQVLDLVRLSWELEPGQSVEMHGRKIHGWGLRQYMPHLWGSGRKRDVAVGAEQVPVFFLDGDPAERWRRDLTVDWAKRHGAISSHRRMKNLLERFTGADGWIEDAMWAGTYYHEQLVRKIVHERTMEDLDPLVLGDWAPVDASDAAKLAETLSNTADERPDVVLGGVDPHFGLRVTGSLAKAGVRLLVKGRWVKPEGSELPTRTRRVLSGSWRTGEWRINRSFTNVGPDVAPEQWRVGLSDGRTTLILRGREGIEAAKLMRRDKGLVNYRAPEQYEAVAEVVRKALGYDIRTGRMDPGSVPGRFGALLSDMADRVNRVLYHTQLGGGVNPKAWLVQTIDGFLQNFAGVGGKETLEAQADFEGFEGFWSEVVTAADPATAYREALARRRDDPYVRLVRPVMDASGMNLNEVLRSEKQLTPRTPREAAMQRLDRASFLSFSLADVRAKETAYYAAYKKFVEAKQTVDPSGGAPVRIVGEPLPLGELFRYGRDAVSAHDLARGVMERAHFTGPRWSMPGVVQLPGWPFLGHLGTISTNIAASFWRGAADAVRYAATGDQQYEYTALRSARYLVGLAAFYWLARLIGRDVGEYVGPHPADLGFGAARLGKAIPALHELPPWVRIPALSYPDERSMPQKLLLSEKPEEGVVAMFGDAMLRTMSGEKAADALSDAWRPWWSTWSRTIGMGPWTRSGRPLVAGLLAERSDLDPERPYVVRDPAYFGPDGRTRYRSGFDAFFGDVVLPGWSAQDSAGHHRVGWARMLADVRGRTRASLGKDLKSADPALRASAYRELIERGFTVEDWRQRKQGIMDALPSALRRGLGAGSTASKLRVFAESAAEYPPAVRKLALRYILPETKGGRPDGVDPSTWAEVAAALNAPWSR